MRSGDSGVKVELPSDGGSFAEISRGRRGDRSGVLPLREARVFVYFAHVNGM